MKIYSFERHTKRYVKLLLPTRGNYSWAVRNSRSLAYSNRSPATRPLQDGHYEFFFSICPRALLHTRVCSHLNYTKSTFRPFDVWTSFELQNAVFKPLFYSVLRGEKIKVRTNSNSFLKNRITEKKDRTRHS